MFIQGKRIDNEVIEITAKKTGVSKSYIEAINSFQFKLVSESLKTSKSVEITGLGVIKVKPKIVTKNIEKKKKQLQLFQELVSKEADEKKKSKLEAAIIGKKELIKYLESKV